MAQRRSKRRGWGKIRRLPSGRWQASYVGPDTVRYPGPDTFDAQIDAEAWLAMVRSQIAAGTWRSPDAQDVDPDLLTFGAYATDWLAERDLRDSTRRIYSHALNRYILPTFGDRPIGEITPAHVSRWLSSVRRQTGPTQSAHAYQVLRTVFNAAVMQDIVPTSPCRVPGGGQVKRASQAEVLEPGEIAALVEAITPPLQALVLLGAWAGLRMGELLELRRKDLDLDAGTVTVARQVQHLTGRPPLAVPPKTAAGHRTVYLPPHVVDHLREHVREHAAPGKDGLLFPAPRGGHQVPSTVRTQFKRAAAAIGHPGLRVHDLRHSAAVLAARTGATVAELQSRLGHSSPAAAMRYQHAVQSRDAHIAARLSELAHGEDRQ